MAGLKEIRRRIRSVRSTKKITYAMKLVSAVKLRKTQDALINTREYTRALGDLLGNLLLERETCQFLHPLMTVRESVKRARFLVVGGSRGLCGAYNMNINKLIESNSQSRAQAGVESEYVLLGKKPADYFRLRKRQPLNSYEKLSEDPGAWPLEEICAEAETDFSGGKVDEVYVIYTKFNSAMSVYPVVEKLLPIDTEMLCEFAAQTGAQAAGRMLFEPSPQEVFNTVVPLCVRARLCHAALEAKTSEHGSRMTAMESATKNAGELIDKLGLMHNKLRQAGITGEILDIIGGSQTAAR